MWLYVGAGVLAVAAMVFLVWRWEKSSTAHLVSNTHPGRTATLNILGMQGALVSVYQDGVCVYSNILYLHEVAPTLAEWGFK